MREDPEPAPSDQVLERLHATLRELPVLAGEPRTVEALTGGLTNFNFKVTTPGRTAVVRLSSSDADLLAIDRDAENLNSRRAAESGAAPEVLDYLPHRRALVVAWVEGRTLVAGDMHAEVMLERVADVCRTLHAGPRFVGDFDMFAIQRRYLDIVVTHGFRLPDRYLDLMPQVDRIAAALAVRRTPTVPCNNDLLAANFIDDGQRLWAIDYEYAGNNDACFELGNIAGECRLPADGLAELVTAYYGRPVRHKIARARLLGLAGMYGWTLWGAIQHAVSPIDFDFWAWAMERWEGAAAGMTSAGFAGLLDEAARDD